MSAKDIDVIGSKAFQELIKAIFTQSSNRLMLSAPVSVIYALDYLHQPGRHATKVLILEESAGHMSQAEPVSLSLFEHRWHVLHSRLTLKEGKIVHVLGRKIHFFSYLLVIFRLAQSNSFYDLHLAWNGILHKTNPK